LTQIFGHFSAIFRPFLGHFPHFFPIVLKRNGPGKYDFLVAVFRGNALGDRVELDVGGLFFYNKISNKKKKKKKKNE
jgi:hypothetical protein